MIETTGRLVWRPSIALLLSLWYSISAFVLIFVATGFLYWVLASNFEREDDRFARDELANIRLVLNASPPAEAARGLSGAPRAVVDDRELYVRLLTATGSVVTQTEGMETVAPLPSALDLAKSLKGPPLRRRVRSQEGDRFDTVMAPVDDSGSSARGFVQLAMNHGDEEDLLALYRRRMAFALGLSLLATVLMGHVIAQRGLRPIRSIGEAADRVGSSTLHERIPTTGLPQDLSGLAGTFNTMLDRLEEAFGQIARFSDDVAHELRTPINNLRGEIEVALTKERSGADYRNVLGSGLEECERMSRVIQSLLFLARADASRDPLRREVVNVGNALTAVSDFYEAAASEKGVALRIEEAPNDTVMLDRTLFQQAISNLVSNAIAYTGPGGSVTLAATSDTTALHLHVTDTGEGIAAEHLPKVFDRFYRADRARSGPDHAGLGLAIVQSIVRRHGGVVSVESAIGAGTDVHLVFPHHRRDDDTVI